MKKRFGCLIVASILMGGMTANSAQLVETNDLQLAGYVCDATGAVIPGANVVVRVQGQQIADAKTDGTGQFRFQGAVGTYDLTVMAGGFKTLHNDGVPFVSGTAAKLIVSVDPNGVIMGPRVAPPPDMPTENPLPSSSIVGETIPSIGGQATPAGIPSQNMSWEYGVLVQGGVGLQDRTDFSFVMVGGHLGKVLTSEIGTGLFKGNFEYAVEVFPFWQSYTPKFPRIKCPAGATSALQCSAPYTVGGKYTGASITPIILRWNLTHGDRFMPWVQGAGGVLWTNHKYPAVGNLNPLDPTQTGPGADTSVWNFTPQFGVGAHYFVRPRRSVDFSANAVHISSASLGDKNPGVNTSVQFSVGYSWWK